MERRRVIVAFGVLVIGYAGVATLASGGLAPRDLLVISAIGVLIFAVAVAVIRGRT